MADARRIVIEFLGNDKSFSSTADKISGSTSTLGDKFKKFSKLAAVGMGVAAGAVVKFGIDAIGKASDLNETISKSETIFGDHFDTMDKWAKGAADAAGLSRGAALDIASSFGDMFSQIGFAGKEAANMSRDVVQLSADLGSFNNLPTAEVADMMSAAFRGEYDSLQRLIPNINATRVETEALERTGKKSADALTAQEKAAATLAIVHRDGKKAAGDFEKTSDSLANQQKILSARFENVQASIGQKLLPVAVDLMTWANDKFIPGFSKVAKAVLPAVVTAFKAVVEIIKVLGKIGKWLWNNVFQPVFKLLVDAIGKVLTWFGKMLQVIGKVPKMGWVGDLGDKLVNAGDKASGLSDKIRDIPDKHNTNITMNTAAANMALSQLEDRLGMLANHLGGMFGGGGGGGSPRSTTTAIGGGVWSAAPGSNSGPGGLGSPRMARGIPNVGETIQVNLYVDGKVLHQSLMKRKRTLGRELGLA